MLYTYANKIINQSINQLDRQATDRYAFHLSSAPYDKEESPDGDCSYANYSKSDSDENEGK